MKNIECDRVWRGAKLLTLDPRLPGLGRIDNGAVAALGEEIVYVGADEGVEFHAAETIDCRGRWITPGLIDCHTHLVHGGDRAHEFELRLAGASYEEIARSGGGIASTMRATREASEDALVRSALPRLDALIAEGVTTVEIKSGYGLSVEDELKQLRAARQLGRARDVSIVTTLLAAHAVPPEMAGDHERYIAEVCEHIIPAAAAAGVADAVDAFCETIAFSPEQIDRVFRAAEENGLPVKIHAEQLSNQGAAALAASHGALSADHLEFLDEAGVVAMADAGVVAVLLPGAFYFLRETKAPPIALLRQHGVAMALATDCNPGTSPLTSLLLAMNMGATVFRLTVEECLTAVTRNAARALGLQDQVGTLEVGKRCDLAIWNIDEPAQLVYRMGFNPLEVRVWRGR